MPAADESPDVAAADPDHRVSPVDVGLALAVAPVRGSVRLTVRLTRGTATRVARLAGPVAGRLVLHPPLVPVQAQPGTLLVALSQRGRLRRNELQGRVDTLLDALVPRVSDAVVRRLDVEAIVSRLDLPGLTQHVIAEIDLPEIIRESTAVVSSEAVREVRMRGVSGDATVGRAVDRMLLRHRRFATPS